MTGRRGKYGVWGGHKLRRPSTSASVPASSQPIRPSIVPGPPQFPETLPHTSSNAFQPQQTPMNNHVLLDLVPPQPPPIPNQQSAAQQPPQSVPRTESSSSQVTSQASKSSKVYVEPEGDGFKPNPTPVTHSVTDIIQSKFDEPWPNWKKVPMNIRDLWFGQFEKRYWWHHEHNNTIRKNFEKKGAARMKGMLADAREKGMKPQWMNDEVWNGLCAYWESPEFKVKAERNKRNRASDCGGLGESLHTAGSIPFTEARRNLTKILGREPTIDEFFLYTHTKKDDGDIWVDKRSAHAYEKFKKKKDELTQSSGTSTSTNATSTNVGSTAEGSTIGGEQPTQAVDEVEIWTESVGLTKKGKVYGFGLHASTFKESSSGSQKSTDTSQHKSVPVVETPEFKAAVADITTKLEEVQKSNEEKDKQMKRLKKKNQRLKQKVDILFEKLNMAPLDGSESEDD